MSKSDKLKTDKLNIVKTLVTNISNRQSQFHSSCIDICWDEKERQKILKTVAKMDVQIDKTIADVRKIFSPKLDSFKSSEICLLAYVFTSGFTMSVPRVIDSKDLDEIIRGRAIEVLEIMDSLTVGGNLYQHISKVEARRGNGFDFDVRSADLLWNYLMSDSIKHGGHAL
jgi:hypothetical protein